MRPDDGHAASGRVQNVAAARGAQAAPVRLAAPQDADPALAAAGAPPAAAPEPQLEGGGPGGGGPGAERRHQGGLAAQKAPTHAQTAPALSGLREDATGEGPFARWRTARP